MRVALVATVRNEASTISALLASIDAQSRRPDEIAIADGGSTDGTLSLLEGWAAAREHVTVIRAPGSNIAAGRNVAIEKTTAGAIAVTDGGCVLDGRWLEMIVAGLQTGAQVAMGYYEPLASGGFERIVTSLTVPDVFEIDPQRFMPSSRSIAFRREVWEGAGRYPEWLDVGEDMYFNFRVLDMASARIFVPTAIVHWRPRSTVGGFVRQYYRYAYGDGVAGMYPLRHAVRFLAYGVSVASVVVATRYPTAILVPIVGAAIWLTPAYRRARRRLGRDRPDTLALIPFLTVLMDVAKMAGYIAGLLRRWRHR